MVKRDYLELFPADAKPLDRDSLVSRALDRAHDIRKFEIDLYWRRAAYFWVFIASLFAAFGVLFPLWDAWSSLSLSGPQLAGLYAVSVGGFFASLSWYLVNRGSKYWQENWEAHVDALENSLEGPLYKAILVRQNFWRPLAGHPFSVSRINILLSGLVTGLWIAIVVLIVLFTFPVTLLGWWGVAVAVSVFAVFVGLAIWLGKRVESNLPLASAASDTPDAKPDKGGEAAGEHRLFQVRPVVTEIRK